VEGDRLVGIVTDRDLRQASPSPATSLEIHELHSVLEKVKVRDIMTSQVVTATSEMPIDAAARLMLTHLEGVPLDPLVKWLEASGHIVLSAIA
jgi:acetoin utilization protein AcuB